MVNIDVNHDDAIIDNVIFDFQEQNQLIFERIYEFMDYLEDDTVYEMHRFIAATNFYQYLDETCNVWKQEQQLVDDLVRISNKYLNTIWLNAGIISVQEGVAYPDESHIRDRHSIDLMRAIHYFMDIHINA